MLDDRPPRSPRVRMRLATLLGGLGLALALLSALDPPLFSRVWTGPLLAMAAAFLEFRREKSCSRRSVVIATLATALAVGAAVRPEFPRTDFRQYFCYLRSLAMDGDLDFANEWEHYGFDEPLTPTGHRRVQGSIGPALFWSPFYAVAHVYVAVSRTLGIDRGPADGYQGPYARATIAGTLTAAVLASFLLGSVVAARTDSRIAVLAVAGAIACSPILHYLFVEPGMAHGLTYALTAVAIWAADRAARAPSVVAWARLGLVVGLLALVRPQAAAVGLLFVPLAVRESWSRRARLSWMLAAAAAALVGFVPQLVAWKVIYGQWFTSTSELQAWAEQAGVRQQVLFRPSSWIDPRSLHLWDTLFSADSGFFTWSPAMLPGLLGLFFAIPRFGLLATGGLLVFAVTAWFNGSVGTYGAGDSFGARRFDLVVPFVSMGFAVILSALRARPLLAPALVLAGAGLWNIGLIRLREEGRRASSSQFRLTRVAPLERVAALQAAQARELADRTLGAAFGEGGRAFAYKALVGEYAFFNVLEEGRFEMTRVDSRALREGWSSPINRAGPPQYRTALYPRSCVVFPLMIAAPLRVTVTARTPERIPEQRLRVSLNGHGHPEIPLPRAFTDLTFDLPREEARAPMNRLCLEFAQGAAKGDEGQQIAAHVRRIVLASRTPTFPSPVWGVRRADR
jgi:hypothetical protein